MRNVRRALTVAVAACGLAGCGGTGAQMSGVEATRGYMGLESVSVRPEAIRRLNLRVDHGVLVYCVRHGMAADKAGLRAGHFVLFGTTYWPVGGDQIVDVDGRPLADRAALFRILGRTRPGDRIRLGVDRRWRRMHVTMVLGRGGRSSSCNHLPPIPGQGYPPP